MVEEMEVRAAPGNSQRLSKLTHHLGGWRTSVVEAVRITNGMLIHGRR